MIVTLKFRTRRHAPLEFTGTWIPDVMGTWFIALRPGAGEAAPSKGLIPSGAPYFRREDEEAVRRYCARLIELARRGVVVAKPETSTEWFARYTDVHASLGKGTSQHAGDWKLYVAPFGGDVPLTAWTPATIKAIRDNLAARLKSGELSGDRVANVWSTCLKAPLSRAFSDDDPKYGAVRVGAFASNPAFGIKPPISRADQSETARERVALSPSEAVTLLTCESIPAERRRLYALLAYSGLRPGEAYSLRWSDVRLDAETPCLVVDSARDMKTGEEGAPKTRESVRKVPIHPELRPMLARMRGAADALVFPVDRPRDAEKMAHLLRADLLTAGIKRPELHGGTAHTRPFDVRSFRTTFGTWCDRLGVDSAMLDKWLGHKPKTTSAAHYRKHTPSFEEIPARPVLADTTPPFPRFEASREPRGNWEPPQDLNRVITAASALRGNYADADENTSPQAQNRGRREPSRPMGTSEDTPHPNGSRLRLVK